MGTVAKRSGWRPAAQRQMLSCVAGIVVASLAFCAFEKADAQATAPAGATKPSVTRPTTGKSKLGYSLTRPTTQPVIRIGILPTRSSNDVRGKWQPTAEYLQSALANDFPGYRVEVESLLRHELELAISQHTIDFFHTNPAMYVEFEDRYGCQPIATFKNIRRRDKVHKQDIVCSEFGGVIFTRADRNDINQLSDLRGKRFLASERNAFGGWWMAQREMKANGIDPGSLVVSFAEPGTQDAVPHEVLSGKFDAGSVRTDLLERLAADGSLKMPDLKVINPQPIDDQFPFVRSTRLYPEWPMGAVKTNNPQQERIAKQVAAALLMMDPGNNAARKSRGAGWALPHNYEPVRELLRELRLNPYQELPKLTLVEATKQHKYTAAAVVSAVAILLGISLYVICLNIKQHRLGRQLTAELEQKQKAEKALEESEAFYHSLVQYLPQSTFRKDLDGRFTFVNEKFCAQVGKPLAEIRGKTDLDLFPRALAEKYRADDTAVITSGTLIDVVEQYIDGNGETLFVHTVKTPLYDGNGKVIGTQGIFWNVTDRKRAELKLEEQNRLLEQTARSEHEAHQKLILAQGALVQTEKLAGLGQMVAGVAHEINNPLSFVGNNMAVLQRDVASLQELLALYHQSDGTLAQVRPDLSKQIHELNERIDYRYTMGNLQELTARSREGLKRIQQIVKDLRDFARLDAGDLQEVDLNQGLESTVNIIRGRAKRAQVALETSFDPVPLITCHAAKINQAVMNLLANAIDACQEGGRVMLSTRPVTDADHFTGVEIAIADTGSGIPTAIRDRIFDPFFTTKPQGEGVGLGLAITYGIVKDHGGRIQVESEEGKGSRFVIFVPGTTVPTSQPSG